MGGSGPFGESSGTVDADRGGELPHAPQRQTADDGRRPRTRAPGQPAQLGRQGPPEGLFPPNGGRTAYRIGRRPGRRDRAAAAAADGRGRPTGPAMTGLQRRAASGRSLLCCATRTTPCARPADPAHGRRRPARAGGRPLARSLDHLARTPPERARRRLRGDVRPAPPLLPAPDLLHPRRHPQARHGAGAVRTPTARPGSSSSTASCPTTCRRCSSSPRRSTPPPGRRLLREYRAGLELLRARADRGRVAVRGGASSRGLGDPAPAARPATRAVARLAAEGPPGEQVGLDPFGPPEVSGARR